MSDGYLYHGTSPLNVIGIRRAGLCISKHTLTNYPEKKNTFWFGGSFEDGLNYAHSVPRHLSSNRLYRRFGNLVFSNVLHISPDIPRAMIRVRRDDGEIQKCAVQSGKWVYKIRCKQKCIFPPTLEVCILPGQNRISNLMEKYDMPGSTVDTIYEQWCHTRWHPIKFKSKHPK